MKHSEKTRQKMRDAKLGKKLSKETRERMSAAMRRRWENPEFRERQTAMLRRNQAKASAAGHAALAAMEIPPPRPRARLRPDLKTSEGRYYVKLRRALGVIAAREALGIGQ